MFFCLFFFFLGLIDLKMFSQARWLDIEIWWQLHSMTEHNFIRKSNQLRCSCVWIFQQCSKRNCRAHHMGSPLPLSGGAAMIAAAVTQALLTPCSHIQAQRTDTTTCHVCYDDEHTHFHYMQGSISLPLSPSLSPTSLLHFLLLGKHHHYDVCT